MYGYDPGNTQFKDETVKGIKPQGKPWTQNERFISPPQAAGI
jgi:hypothetical protein